MINMKKGFTKKEAMEIEKKVKAKGWKIEEDDLYAINKDDSIFWWQYTDSSIFTISKGRKRYGIFVLGDIEINDPKTGEPYFYVKGGNPIEGDDSDLTDDVLKNGDYKHINWFEIVEEEDDEEVDSKWDLMEGSLKKTVKELLYEIGIK